ncbi:hypothetical protein [Amycolatopsis orientalis]|uniref:hypothetical protein n=1 Tax=Amycolatopsis orientalis TaxID=31958 RepID=UPI00056A7F00|nr:hypothetical protein [Amycolatopsis orientalis]
MAEPNATDHDRQADPPRRTAGRIIRGIVLILGALALLAGGIQAIVDPDAVIAGSSHSGRRMDTDTEAKLGGLLLCSFGITVMIFGIALIATKGPLFGKRAE